MPLYHFTCTGCELHDRKILPAGAQKRKFSCIACGAPLKRSPRAPSTQMMESLDNGAMVRRVERLQNAEELYRDRAKSDPRTAKPT